MALSKIDVANMVTGATPVANGGTGLTSGTTDQFLKFTGSTTLASAADNTGGITEVDMWRYTANTTGDLAPIASNLERVDTVFDKIGTGMSQSSGIFTFPSTGIWEITFGAYSYVDGENRDFNAQILATPDNSTYTVRANSTGAQFHASSSNTSGNSQAKLIFDVTNVTTHKVRFDWSVVNDDTHLYGDSVSNKTWFQFIRLGDT
jgi:hypothetical protein